MILLVSVCVKMVTFSQELHLDVYPDEEELHFESVFLGALLRRFDSWYC